MILSAQRRAVTLIELIIVVGVLLFLLGIFLPAIARVRSAAARQVSLNNLRQLGLAVHNFCDSQNGRLPPALGKANNNEGPVHFHLLPYLEQEALFRSAEGASWKNGAYKTVVPSFLDPRDTTAPPQNLFQGWLATTNYAANWMVFKTGNQRLGAILDGTSNTLMFATRYQLCNGQPTGWGYPEIYTWAPLFAYYTTAKFQVSPKQADCDPTLPQTIADQLITVSLCDGSTRTIAPTISSLTWRLLCDPEDGMVLDEDF
ncbi:MAG: DUF1559 domain-containing protein [Gemmataceae bacterium]|nr:DUF1559 domain-containing protein [Gemmataceae bacterium]